MEERTIKKFVRNFHTKTIMSELNLSLQCGKREGGFYVFELFIHFYQWSVEFLGF